jgi:NMD protein affecting ribosome stability and mRNA decay
LPRLTPAGVIQCSGCGAFYYRRHWTLNPPGKISTQVHVHPVYCPACNKIKDRYPGGELRLAGFDSAERREIARILRNEEDRARAKNPLERIMRMEAADGGWKIETTTEKLAQRLGRAVHKARGGSVEYKWSHNNKFVRVLWEKVE